MANRPDSRRPREAGCAVVAVLTRFPIATSPDVFDPSQESLISTQFIAATRPSMRERNAWLSDDKPGSRGWKYLGVCDHSFHRHEIPLRNADSSRRAEGGSAQSNGYEGIREADVGCWNGLRSRRCVHSTRRTSPGRVMARGREMGLWARADLGNREEMVGESFASARKSCRCDFAREVFREIPSNTLTSDT